MNFKSPQHRSRLARNFAVVAAATVLATGCVPLKTRIAGTGAGLASPASLAILVPDSESPQIDPKLQSAVTTALTGQGYVLADDAPYIVDFSFADRPVSIGAVPAGAVAPPPAAKTFRIFQKCKDRTHRLTMVVADRKTGQVVYSGSAQEIHCKGTAEESLAPLAAAVVADLKLPGGNREIVRAGKK